MLLVGCRPGLAGNNRGMIGNYVTARGLAERRVFGAARAARGGPERTAVDVTVVRIGA